MTSQDNFSQKVTGVLLAVLMVLSMVAVPMAGSVAAAPSPDDPSPTEVSEGSTYWAGQELVVSEDLPEDTEVTLREDTDDEKFVSQYNSSDNGEVNINTDNLDTGSYFVSWSDNGTDYKVTFEVQEQRFDVDAEQSMVENEGNNTAFDVEFDSNRANYEVHVYEADDNLDASELDEIFQTEGDVRTNTDGDDYYVVSGTNSNEYEVDFEDVDTGDYEFVFDVTTSAAEDSFEVSVHEQGDIQANFQQSSYTDFAGNIVEFTVEVENTDEFDLQIGDEDEIGYEYVVGVDAGDEEEVTFLFNTAIAGQEVVPVSIHEDTDDASLVNPENDMELSSPLVADSYDMSVSVDGNERDISGLNLVDRNEPTVVNHAATGEEAIEDLEDVEEYAVQSDLVTDADHYILELNAEGMQHYFDGASAEDFEDGAALDAYGITLEIEETNPGPNAQAQTVDLSNGTFVASEDYDSDSYYFVFAAADLGFDDEDEFTATFEVTEDNPYIDEEEDELEAETHGEYQEAEFEFNNQNDDDVVEMETAEDSVLSADTNIAPGTEVRMTVRSSSPHAFVTTEEVTVSDDRTAESTYDLSEVEAGHEFTVQVNNFTDRMDAVAVDAGPAMYDYDVTVENEMGDLLDSDVTVDGQSAEHTADDSPVTFELEDGEYTVEASADGYEDGSETITVDGEGGEVTLTLTEEPEVYNLTVETVDEDGNAVDASVSVGGQSDTTQDGSATFDLEEGDYTVEASADGYEDATESVTLDGDETVSLTLVEEETTDDGTDDATPTDDGDDDDEETDGQPGFGVVVALVALMAAALLAFRRQD